MAELLEQLYNENLMAETGSQILQYSGNADLGLGQDTAIPVSPPNPDLNAVRQASENLKLFDHQNNVLLYQQKIKDRDKTLELLAQGKVNAGQILPEDQKYYDDAEKAQTEAYKAIKGLQDKDGIANYLDKTRQLSDLVTNTQHRWAEVAKLNAEKASQTLPEDVSAYEKHIQAQRAKPIGQLIDPYQKAFSFNDDEMMKPIIGSGMISKGIGGTIPQDNKTITTTDANGKVTTKTVEGVNKNAPAVKGQKLNDNGVAVDANGNLSEFTETPEKYFDYNNFLKNAESAYLGGGKDAENQRQWFNKFHESQPYMQEDLVKQYNNRLKTYGEQRGLTPDENGQYPNEIKFKKMPDGKILLNETPSSFAAKSTLARVEGDYVQKPQRLFDKDIAAHNLAVMNYKEKLMKDKGDLAVKWANFGLSKDKFNKSGKEDLASAASVINEATSIINKGVKTQVDVGNGKTEEVLRIGDPTLLSSFASIDKDGKATNPPDAIDYDTETNQAKLIYYAPKKTASGKNFIEKSIPLDQRTWLKLIAKRSFPNKEIGNVNTLVDDALNANDNSLYKISQKQNNSSSSTISINDIPAGTKPVLKNGKYYYKDKEIVE